MPIYDPKHVEYSINSGYIEIVLENGKKVPAYWAHPQMGGKFPALVLLHDWWGVVGIIRRLANYFAQTGYYVIVPDLFDKQTANTPKEAMALVEKLDETEGRMRVYTAIDVVERHHQTNRQTGVVGLGMGGSLALDAALHHPHLEAVVAFSGFPHRNLGKFNECKIPIFACYGSLEPHIAPPIIHRLRDELAQSPDAVKHRVEMVNGLAHEFFSDQLTEAQRDLSRQALKMATDFLDQHLHRPLPRRAIQRM
ncbi:MAG: dienelactone hydrolase family protein [Anaerolineae bacterium]|jgi:carboxymethylenebutenolidase|nr:dienelactone hydrolase family protein [Anaerolineae bacterium]